MKTTIKKNLIIFHKPHEWQSIQHQLALDYGTKILISYVCKRELGFTIRHHKGLVPYMERYGDQALWLSKEAFKGKTVDRKHQLAYEDQVHLDFYNESQMSWFVLKYLNHD